MTCRSVFALLLALALLCACLPATADTVPTTSVALQGGSIEMNRRNGILFGYLKDDTHYSLFDAQGNRITTQPYQSIKALENMFEVATATEGVNVFGVIDEKGNEVIPMQYGDFNYVSDRWILGVVLEPATADNYDYKTYNNDAFFLISRYDVYHCGNLVGSLGRTEVRNLYAKGDFLTVSDLTGAYTYYDQYMNKSAYPNNKFSAEYEEVYREKTVWHRASNQKAFTPGCTLTSDQVEQDIYYDSKGNFLDLQGNVLFTAQKAYESVRNFIGDYAVVRFNGKYGMIDRQGNEVIPCEYDSTMACSNSYFSLGYQLVIKDGKVGYVDVNGNVTCDFKYSKSISNNLPFTSLKDLDGSYVVLSAAIGELPQRYKSINFSSSENCGLIALIDMQGNGGVVDLYGNEVVPFNSKYTSASSFTLSHDGSTILIYEGSRQYTVITVGEAAASVAETVTEEAVSEAPAADSWTCESCKAENAGKFCTNCGGAKPVPTLAPTEAPVDGSWTCESCKAANSGKFCTNCGSPKPVEAQPLKCAGCGYTPKEGETPKFCPECGTPFNK